VVIIPCALIHRGTLLNIARFSTVAPAIHCKPYLIGKGMPCNKPGLVQFRATLVKRALERQAESVDLRFVSVVTLSAFSQLKHSNVRTSKSRRAVLTRVSTIGAWHSTQRWFLISFDAKQNCGSGDCTLLSLIRWEQDTLSHR
jgi:hypothetical protein